MHCLQAKPYEYTCYASQTAVTCVLANRLFHVLGKDYFMLHKILCGFKTAHSPFKCVCVTMCSLVMSLFSCDYIKMEID